MDSPEHESEIIERIQTEVETSGKCSISWAAEQVTHNKISMEEQVRLANLLANSKLYVIEKKQSEVFVLKNESYLSFEKSKAAKSHKRLKYLAGLILTILIYLVFHFFLPNLKSKVHPILPRENQHHRPETLEISRDKDNYKSFSVADTLYINYKTDKDQKGLNK